MKTTVNAPKVEVTLELTAQEYASLIQALPRAIQADSEHDFLTGDEVEAFAELEEGLRNGEVDV